ncbi:hypothetical protein OH76DRAFT_246620 [Lentinus brumalis]|uniref:Secreted protein n=1 Tax=Lentinus brumalis TaxID=2498619 RepID=A0A371CLU4_9APHY|nr:hypothetical protein OH76DRAFT_246620 [Polyporus brumalis]
MPLLLALTLAYCISPPSCSAYGYNPFGDRLTPKAPSPRFVEVTGPKPRVYPTGKLECFNPHEPDLLSTRNMRGCSNSRSLVRSVRCASHWMRRRSAGRAVRPGPISDRRSREGTYFTSRGDSRSSWRTTWTTPALVDRLRGPLSAPSPPADEEIRTR